MAGTACWPGWTRQGQEAPGRTRPPEAGKWEYQASAGFTCRLPPTLNLAMHQPVKPTSEAASSATDGERGPRHCHCWRAWPPTHAPDGWRAWALSCTGAGGPQSKNNWEVMTGSSTDPTSSQALGCRRVPYGSQSDLVMGSSPSCCDFLPCPSHLLGELAIIEMHRTHRLLFYLIYSFVLVGSPGNVFNEPFSECS